MAKHSAASLLAGAVLTVFAIGACDGQSPETTHPTSPASPTPATPAPTGETPSTPTTAQTVTSLSITGVPQSFTVGQTLPLTATASLSDGTRKDLPGSDITWQSSDGRVATISSAGLLTLVGAGSADLKATYQNIAGTARAVATFDVSGVVHESAPTESAVPGALVGIRFGPQDGQTTTTDVTGHFSFHKIEAPGFTIWASKTDYDAASWGVVQLPRDAVADIHMTPSAGAVPFGISGSNALTLPTLNQILRCSQDLAQLGEVFRSVAWPRVAAQFAVYHSGNIVVSEALNPGAYEQGVELIKFSSHGCIVWSESRFGTLLANSSNRPVQPPPAVEGGYDYAIVFEGDYFLDGVPYRLELTRPR